MSQAAIAITGVMFGDGVINIQYVEERESTNAVMIARSMTVEMEHIAAEVDDLAELIEQIVDKGLLMLRNPPKRIRRSFAEDVQEDFDDDQE